MGRISEQTIEHVRSSADIIDVVSSYVQLKKRGQNHFGNCPFHQEKTASFSVNAAKQIFHCFGCGVGGSAINFIMKIEGLEFIDAVKFLGERYNIPVEFEGGDSRPKQLISQLYEIQNISVNHFVENLKTPIGKEVITYFKDRGLTDKTIQMFQLGYSQDKWQMLLEVLRKQNFSADALNNSGLVLSNDKGYFDRFRSRIMFPIHNTSAKIVGVAGRVFKSDDPAKYINSPETPIYSKSSILFGLYQTKKDVREKNQIIIVEGYMDFLQLYQSGIQHIAAVSGTALTDGQAREIRKFTNNVAVSYDGDKAGIAAAIRAGYVLLKNGLTPSVVVIPNGIDPDDWIKKDGPAPFLDAVENSENVIQFHFDHFIGNMGNASDKARFIRESVQELSLISDTVIRELYLQKLSEITKVSEKSIFQALENILGRMRQRQPAKSPEKTSQNQRGKLNPNQRLEDEIIKLCFVEDEKVRKYLYDNFDNNWLQSRINRKIYDSVFIHLHSQQQPSVPVVLDSLIESIEQKVLSALTIDLEKMISSLKFVKDCTRRLEEIYLKKQLSQQREKLKIITSGDPIEMEVIQDISTIQVALKQLKSKYKHEE
jgi:DNA primase